MSAVVDYITLGGGCFWCLEAVYEQVEGVVSVESGYCNGPVVGPTYEAVCSGRTGHAEVVRLGFDPAVISLQEILEIFFVIHDPTTLNRQGNDVGTQYRSGIYWENLVQQEVVRAVVDALNTGLGGRIVTEVVPVSNYSKAEPYHQHYFASNPGSGYCAFVVGPKVEKFRKTFASRIRKGAG